MALPPTRRHRRTKTAPVDAGAAYIRLLKQHLLTPDPRSHAEFLADVRTEQAPGRLVTPAAAALLDRLERAS